MDFLRCFTTLLCWSNCLLNDTGKSIRVGGAALLVNNGISRKVKTAREKGGIHKWILYPGGTFAPVHTPLVFMWRSLCLVLLFQPSSLGHRRRRRLRCL
jgi:hypothetical protein